MFNILVDFALNELHMHSVLNTVLFNYMFYYIVV